MFISSIFTLYILDNSIPIEKLSVIVSALCFCMLITFILTSYHGKTLSMMGVTISCVLFFSFIVSPMSRALSPSDMQRCPQNTVSHLRFLHTTTQVIPKGILNLYLSTDKLLLDLCHVPFYKS